MNLGPDYDRDREGARAVPGEGSGEPHHGTAQAPAHTADDVRALLGRDALQRAYNGLCGAYAELERGIGIVGPSGDLTAVLDDIWDARTRLAPIAFPARNDGNASEGATDFKTDPENASSQQFDGDDHG